MKREVKLFFPVDVSSAEEAHELLAEVGPYVDVAKVGMELDNNAGLPTMVVICNAHGKEVFVDKKFFDIPNTVGKAAAGVTSFGVDYFNVMALGGKRMMAAAVESAALRAQKIQVKRPKIIAVSMLTSMAYDEVVSEAGVVPPVLIMMLQKAAMDGLIGEEVLPLLQKLFSADPADQLKYVAEIVLHLTNDAVEVGVDCALSSPLETSKIRRGHPDIEIINPGIRMPWDPPDDQRRTATPYEAVRDGATGLVVGRPVRNPQGGRTRQDVIDAIRVDIQKALAERG
ncbi:MAG: orotidine 5'-phosphate decarboxylase / HUMPS family protein [Parcubacteria group bacterium]|jgi:orotidine-5'-phosphate decarboxylase